VSGSLRSLKILGDERYLEEIQYLTEKSPTLLLRFAGCTRFNGRWLYERGIDTAGSKYSLDAQGRLDIGDSSHGKTVLKKAALGS
jgi:hypothetical protein